MNELNSSGGNIRVFAAGQTIADIDETKLPKGCAHTKPSIIVKSRGYIDFEFYDKPFTHKNEMWSYSFDDLQICKFIYFYLTTKTEEFRKKARANSVKLPQLCVADTDNFIIPLPPNEEISRIVSKLDTFKDSIENLKRQIDQRRKQYFCYRDQIISLSLSNWPQKTLKDVAVIKNGKDYKNLSTGSVPVYGSGGIMTFVNRFASDKPSVLLPRKGSVENIFYVDKPFWTVDTIYWTEIDTKKMEPKFLFYSLSKYDLKKYAYGGARPSLSQPILYKLEVPLPPLKEQSRIISLLDTFEASISNLEAQLEHRQKQYEYYRNKLLTFE